MSRLRAYLVDDEPLALKRLTRLLDESGRVEIVGACTDPVEALTELARNPPDVLFLDIEMPGMTGFDLLSRLDPQPMVVFTTAYDRYALRAFEDHSIDYLLKPIERDCLERALEKVDRFRGAADAATIATQVIQALRERFLTRIASRIGDRIEFIAIASVTHFFAQDKLTYAATAAKNHVIDSSITELEQRLDPSRFLRIHRATLLNIDYVKELHSWFDGRLVVRLKDGKQTELTVARDRASLLKEKLGA